MVPLWPLGFSLWKLGNEGSHGKLPIRRRQSFAINFQCLGVFMSFPLVYPFPSTCYLLPSIFYFKVLLSTLHVLPSTFTFYLLPFTSPSTLPYLLPCLLHFTFYLTLLYGAHHISLML
jgi:hypothetical protein